MLATIIISAIVAGLMFFVIIGMVKKAKKGESSCGCGCSGCSSQKNCLSQTKK